MGYHCSQRDADILSLLALKFLNVSLKRQRTMDAEKLRIARDKLTRVFRYLEALNQHRLTRADTPHVIAGAGH